MIDWLIAHGLVVRSDLPIPEWLFGWGAAVVLLVSFAALAVLWPEPRLQEARWRPLPGGVGKVLASRPLEIVTGAIGVLLLGVVVYAGLEGSQTATNNFAPTFVYVIFWVGLVAASVLLGDVYRAFNPWRALGRAVAWVAQKAAGGPLPAPLQYPERLGRWPAAAGLLLFTMLELVHSDPGKPENVAIGALVYSVAMFVGMALYGVETWSSRGDAFSVYFNLFSRLSVFAREGREVGIRRWLTGLSKLDPLPGTVAVLAVIIGSTSFDGAAEASLWSNTAPHISDFFHSLGVSPKHALELAFGVGELTFIGLVYGLYRLGVAGARTVGGGFTSRQLAGAFVHSLVPIGFAYVAAHYLTLLLFQGQAIIFLASDPLGDGSNLFGTANHTVDYSVIGATATWYFQVGFVVLGHVTGLTLAHDKALAMYERPRQAVRSQYWMLGVMVCFTSLALWLLSQANQ
jgi:hypothetical protein